jgi:excisionase family DNA binding protein
MEKQVYSVKEVMKILGISRNTVGNMINKGQLKAIRAGNRILIPYWAISDLLAGKGA